MNNPPFKNNKTDSTNTSWHIHAVRLPDGQAVEEWWVHKGVLHDQPIPGVQEPPAAGSFPVS
ncbi:MAG: hypothetical protein U0401_34125 [Anaerolineae bacterium]